MKIRTALSFLIMMFTLIGCASKKEPVVDAESMEESTSSSETIRASAPPPTPVFYQLAPTQPPEPYDEYIPESPRPMEQIWRNGFWSFNGVSFSWVSGQFIKRPSPTAAWSPDRWEERGYGWAFVPGHWF